MDNFTRETFTLTFDGPAVERHEIDASILAESLVSLRDLAEKASKLRYGKNADLLFKVRAGFKEGSFGVDLIFDWVVNNPKEAAAVATGGTLAVAGIVAGVIKLYKWTKGKPPIPTSQPVINGNVYITNGEGASLTFSEDVVTLASSTVSKIAIERLTKPLESQGLDKILISDIPGEDASRGSVELTKEDRRYFAQNPEHLIRESEDPLTLEVMTPNLDGKPAGWRFYDGDIEYTATVEDDDFLQQVQDGKYAFRKGDMLEVIMKTTQSKPAVRLVTTRKITRVVQFVPGQAGQSPQKGDGDLGARKLQLD